MRLGIVTDIHLAPAESPASSWHNPHQFATVADRLGRSLAWLAEHGATRVIVPGDLVHHGDAASVDAVLDLLEAGSLPVWVVPGNHDLTVDAAMLETRLAEHPGSRIEILDGRGEALAGGWQAIGLGLEHHGGRAYHAQGLPEVASLPDQPLLVVSHFPILSVTDPAAAAELKYAGDLANRASIAEDLGGRAAPSLVICGHLHIRHTQADGPILQIANSAQIESLFEATLLDLDAGEDVVVSWETVSIDDPWPGVDPGLSPGTQSWRWTGTAWRQET